MTNPNLDPDFSGPPGPNWGLIMALMVSGCIWLTIGLIVGKLWN